MCGIVGYVGKEAALPFLVEGLKKLEYRGYDSAGLALLDTSGLTIRRQLGKVVELEKSVRGIKAQALKTGVGLGHTRWATHGRPSEENAHPHTDCKGQLAVVHNGIVENFRELKSALQKKGHRFTSETDTEVFAHLIEDAHKKLPLVQAVRQAVRQVKGSFALGVVSAKEPDRLVVIRQSSPLVVGIGQDEWYVGSDIPAFLQRTRRVVVLEDGEMAVLSLKDGAEFFGKDGRKQRRTPEEVRWDPLTAEKGGYKHFMLKEIFEQPQAIEDTIRGRLLDAEGDAALDQTGISAEGIKKIQRLVLVACGTSWHAALVGKFYLEQALKLPVEVDFGSEFRYRESLSYKDTLIVCLSQSGETSDTLAALRQAKANGARTLGICNVAGASLTREAHGLLYTHAGPELGVAATKTFSSQLAALYLLSLYLGRRKGTLSAAQGREMIRGIRGVPRLMQKTLKLDGKIQELARQYFKKIDFLFLGRGVNFPIALEGALKLKEISYIHAEGYPAGEMKHGPIALIDENMPVVVLAPEGRVYEKVVSNMEEVKAREGTVIALAHSGDKVMAKRADFFLGLPQAPELISPFLYVIPLQRLAYHIAVRRGCDVDQPRNLAKSVTVE